METLNTKQLVALISAGAIKSVSVKGVDGGFLITVDDKLIEKQRGSARIFRKLQAAATYLKHNGIGTFSVDVSAWCPEQTAIKS